MRLSVTVDVGLRAEVPEAAVASAQVTFPTETPITIRITMKTTYESCALIMTMALAFSVGAAPTLPNQQYQSARRHLAAELDTSRQACKSLPRSSIGLCSAEAVRDYQVASAALDAFYNPSGDGGYKARVAIANAEYLVARRTCDGKEGNVKRFCLSYARAAQIAAKAVAHSPEDTSIMKLALDKRANVARKRMREEEERTEGRHDSISAKRNTELDISMERCETLLDHDRPACFSEAVKRFGPL